MRVPPADSSRERPAEEMTLRETKTRCPVCVRELRGFVRLMDGKAYLCRTCPQHGEAPFLLSNNGALYRDLERFYFDVLRKKDGSKGRITNYSNLFGIKIHEFPSALLPVVLNTNCSTLTADATVAMQCMSGIVFRREGEIRSGRTAELLIEKEAQHQARAAARPS